MSNEGKTVLLLQNKLDQHIEEFHTHVDEYHKHILEEQNRWAQLIHTQEKNAEAITALSESTKGLIEAWGAAEGAMKVGAAFGRFIRWAAGLAVIGTFITWLIDHGH